MTRLLSMLCTAFQFRTNLCTLCYTLLKMFGYFYTVKKCSVNFYTVKIFLLIAHTATYFDSIIILWLCIGIFVPV